MWLWRLAESRMYDPPAYYVRIFPQDLKHAEEQGLTLNICAHSPPCAADQPTDGDDVQP